MGRYRLKTLCIAVASFAAVGLALGQQAEATPSSPVTSGQAAQAAPSGIGLATGLNRAGHSTLANPTYYNRALKSKLWYRTPSGMVFHSCYYHVSNGSYVDSVRGRITQPNGQVTSMPQCAYPRLVQPRATPSLTPSAVTRAKPAAGTSGWMQGFEQSGLPALASLSVQYSVPNAPNTSGAEDLQWSALATDANGDALLQPLIGWGGVETLKNGVVIPNASGSYLEMAAYYFWSGNAVSASFVHVNAQNTIDVSIQSENCSNGGSGCTWTLDANDPNTGADSHFNVGTSPAFTTVIGGMFESYFATNCQMLFANHHLVFRNLQVTRWLAVAGLNAILPHFSKRVVDQECSMSTSFTSNSGDITWSP
jgi:hypothetical protein